MHDHVVDAHRRRLRQVVRILCDLIVEQIRLGHLPTDESETDVVISRSGVVSDAAAAAAFQE